jgi:hypothetical protein
MLIYLIVERTVKKPNHMSTGLNQNRYIGILKP